MPRSAYKPLSHWQDDAAPLYNGERWQDDMSISHRWAYQTEIALPLNIPPAGRIICTLDERPKDPDTVHAEAAAWQAICVQIAKFSHRPRWPEQSENKTLGATVFALILKPTGENLDEYRRIGIAEIPADNGMADGWDTKVVTFV